MSRGVPHATGRNLDRDLMFVDRNGSVNRLTSARARALIKTFGSVRKAARRLGIPKSTLHDLALDQHKLGGSRRANTILSR